MGSAESVSVNHVANCAAQLPDERTEIVGQLHRTLALLRGCDAPGARAQIASMVAALTARLHQLEADAAPARSRSQVSRLIPSPAACELHPLECRAYAMRVAGFDGRRNTSTDVSGAGAALAGIGAGAQRDSRVRGRQNLAGDEPCGTPSSQ